MCIRIGFLADTHLGFDLPRNPRVNRRRRGPDFFANYQRVLDRAVSERFDALVHGGDVFFRTRIGPELVQRAFHPLKRLADRGIPIFVVPGNHERSRIPHRGLAEYPGVFVFDRPRTFTVRVRNQTIRFSGFPYTRSIRRRFAQLMNETGWGKRASDVNLLCVHHCFEGATVGPRDFTFRGGDDVIRHADVPPAFDAVLSGHIHRHQVLTRHLSGKQLAVPVFYPGSIERTSFAERSETKGYLELLIEGKHERNTRPAIEWQFQVLPARPMVERTIRINQPGSELRRELTDIFSSIPRDSILALRLEGEFSSAVSELLSARSLRELAPATLNVQVRIPGGKMGERSRDRRRPTLRLRDPTLW